VKGIKQPGSSKCFVCGVDNPHGLHLNFYTVEPGKVETVYTVPDHFQSYPGVVHGGIIASMMDEVMGRVFMDNDSDRFMVTAELKIRYRKPVPVNQPLTLRGWAVKDRGRMAQAQGEILGPDGDQLVVGEIIVADIPAEIRGTGSLDAMGWKVYPDQEETL
jgi:acyl-coenzyme A thioesterase PaaI-like protein